MKLYVSSFSPFVCCCEENSMFTNELLENLKFYLEESKNGEYYKSQSSLLKWEIGYLLLFFNELNKEKFNRLCSLFSDSKLKKETLYAKFGIPLIDVLTRKFEEFHVVVFAENVDVLSKSRKRKLFLDLIRGDCLSCEVNPLGRVNAKLKSLYPIYLRKETELELIGYACRTSLSKYIYAISIKNLPKEVQTNYKFLKNLLLNLREFWTGRVFSLEETIPKSDMDVILHGDRIKISVEVDCEIYDKYEKLVSPYSVLLNRFYPNEESVDLKKKEIGIDEYSDICKIRTSIEDISNSSKVVESLESLTKKLIEGLKDKYKVDFIGKRHPLSFSLIFDFGEKFKTIHPLVKLHIKNSVEFLIQALLYRYLYVLNSLVRRYYIVETVKVFESGVRCNILPSAVMEEELYKEVIVIVADAIKRFFSGEAIEVELNEQFDIDKSFYPAKFFERIRKVKEVVEKESNEFYELVSLCLTDKISVSGVNFDKVKEFGNLIKELNDKCLKDSYISFHSLGLLEEKTGLLKENFYDIINEREVTVYQLLFSVYLLMFAASGSEKAWKEIVNSTVDTLKLADSEGKLKENFENIEKKLLDFLHS